MKPACFFSSAMPSLDLTTRWAIVGVKDETGTGRMSQELRRCLAPIRHLVAPSYRLKAKPLEGDEPLAATEDEMRAQFAGLQGIIVFEDTEWALAAIRAAHAQGVRVVFIVLWEWLRFYVPEMRLCDLMVCLHGMAWKVTRKLGFRNTARLTWPLDLSPLPARHITGPARRFAHNVGLFEKDDRKSTLLTLEAFARVRRPEIELVVRVQNELPVRVDDPRVQIESRHLENHADLYRLGDVAVQPSKCEGLGFMLLEAIASGLPVLTTDYPPMNEFVRQRTMRASTRWGRFPAEQTSYVHQAHFKIPRVASLARRIEWCASHDLGPISADNRAWAEQTFAPDRVRSEWLAEFDRLITRAS